MRSTLLDSVGQTPDTGWVYAADGLPILRYEVEVDLPALHVEWQPGPPLDAVKEGFVALLHLLRDYHCAALLSDSDHFVGDWSELIPWVRYEMLPVAIGNGLRYLADVLPADPANSLSMYTWREETRGLLRHEVFYSLAAAREWLREEFRLQQVRRLK